MSFLTSIVWKLGINGKKKTGKFTNIWRLSNMELNNQWVNNDSEEKEKNILGQREMLYTKT